MPKKRKNRPHGHYCKVCGEYKANEKFSSKGHAAHICKACSQLSAAEKAESMTLNRLDNMLGGNVSREQKKWLENRLHDDRPEVAETARMVYNACFPYAERNERKQQLVINKLEFEVNTEVPDEFGDEEKVHQVFTADRHTRVLTFRDLDSDEPEQSMTLDGGRMAKLLRWAVHTLEIFMWAEDYCSDSSMDDYDPYEPDWADEGPDDTNYLDVPEPEETEEQIELDPSEITWRVQISYNNGENKDIRCGEEYLPERVEELRWRLMGFYGNMKCECTI